MRRTWLCGIGLAVFVCALPVRAELRWGHQSGELLLHDLGAQVVACSTKASLCGRTGLDPKQLKAGLRAFVKKSRDDEHRRLLRPWADEAGEWRTVVQVGYDILVVHFDPGQQLLEIRPWACFDRTSWDQLDVHSGGEEGIVIPELMKRVRPVYPERARQVHGGGTVVLQAVIDVTGAVADACVAFAQPQNLQLDAAAMGALRNWRYKPATKGGIPVAILTVVEMTWEIR